MPALTALLLGIFHFFNKIKYNLLYGKRKSYYKYQLARPLGPRRTICYAPQTSLFFGVNGNITACCLNRSVILGEIPTDNLKEVWEGEKILKLRTKLSKNDLSMGCFHCKDRINANNFDAVEAALYDNLPTNRKMPSYLIFEISNRCNLKCVMCDNDFSSNIDISDRSIHFPKDVYNESFITQLQEFIPHLLKTKFLGGEPFMIDIYYKIWEQIIRLNPNCLIDIQTNGSILNDKIKDLLAQGNFRISVSLESFKKETYEKIRVKGNYDKIMQNLEWFTEYGKRKNYIFSVSVCPIKQNRFEIPEIIEECNKRNIRIYFNTVLKPEECSLLYLKEDEIIDLIEFYEKYPLSEEKSISKNNKLVFESLINQLKNWKNEIVFRKKEQLKREMDIKQRIETWDNLYTGALKMSEKELKNKLVSHITKEQDNQDKLKLNKAIKELHDNFPNDVYKQMYFFDILSIPSEKIRNDIQNIDWQSLNKKIEAGIQRLREENIAINELKRINEMNNSSRN